MTNNKRKKKLVIVFAVTLIICLIILPLVRWLIPISSLYGSKEENTVPIPHSSPPSGSVPPASQSVSVAALDRVLEPLEQGNIVFDVAQSMEIDKPETINLGLCIAAEKFWSVRKN